MAVLSQANILHEGRADTSVEGVIVDAVHRAHQVHAGYSLFRFARALRDKRFHTYRRLSLAPVLYTNLEPIVKIFDGYVQALAISIQQWQSLAAEVLERSGQLTSGRIFHAYALGKMRYRSTHSDDQAIVGAKMQNGARMFSGHCGSPF